MFALKFNGRFELEYPDEFLQDMQELLKKYKVEYFGRVQTEDLGRYVDFQKIEEAPIKEQESEKV